MVSLVITIVVLIIIATVAMYSGTDTLESAQITVFTSEIRMIQQKVNIEYQNGTLSEKGKNLTELDSNVLSTVKAGAKIRDWTDYRYFDKTELEKINLTGITQEVLINVSSRQIVSVYGIYIPSDNRTYYTQEQLQQQGYIEGTTTY